MFECSGHEALLTFLDLVRRWPNAITEKVAPVSINSITIRFPSKEEEELSHRFTVHRNYLGSIELVTNALYGHGDDQVRQLRVRRHDRSRPKGIRGSSGCLGGKPLASNIEALWSGREESNLRDRP
jgi:hypothetical protein